MNLEVSRLSVSAARVLLRRFLPALAFLVTACLATIPLQAQISPESDQLLHRMYASPDFEVRYFGPSRWLDDGAFYTTVEPSSAVKDAQDIIRYQTATGKREVLISAAKLIPSPPDNAKFSSRLPSSFLLAPKFRSQSKTTPGPRTSLVSFFTPIPRQCGGSTRAETTGYWICSLAHCGNLAVTRPHLH